MICFRQLPSIAALLILATPAVADDARPNDLSSYDRLIKPEHRRHWAFRPVQSPKIPGVKNPQWLRNPIDAFVLAKLEEQGWQPSLPAAPRALLRRLYLDLVGLPPTLLEQQLFLKDSSPEALDRVIDDLLARPGYGERWARHWLDLVRYADTNGYERDADKPHVWRYRDYVIRALNNDKPLDRFILEQLAGDELPDADAQTLIAAGYYRLGPWDDEPADPVEDRFDQLDDMVSTTSQVFLGLTLGCARCHNHKFDPLTMHDYYRMVAVFNPLRRPAEGRTELDQPAAPRSRLETARRTAARAEVAAVGFRNAPASAPLTAWLLSDGRKQLSLLPRGYFMIEPSPNPPVTHLLIRGKATRPGPVVAPGMPAVLVSRQPSFPAADQHTSLRRLTLARWIASPENPLTARVLVNRVWQHHFGEGLVRSPSDFGILGQPPTHPELLDWLASWFVKEGWSLKKLHRLILSSNTYRMSKKWNAEYAARDPEDRLLWRVPYRRLEVEAIRDSTLAASGRLNPKMFGPSMFPEVPREALESHSDPDRIWRPFDERETSRRTIYAHVKRSLVVPMLEVLDLCDTARSTARRAVTTVAPQALSMFNGAFVNRQAAHLAQRLINEVGDESGNQVERAYELVLCRKPTSNERTTMLEFLKQQTGHERARNGKPPGNVDAPRKALEQVCRVLFNLNEFVYPD